MNQTICPLLTIGRDTLAPCQQEDCSWWDYGRRSCALETIAGALDEMANSCERSET